MCGFCIDFLSLRENVAGKCKKSSSLRESTLCVDSWQSIKSILRIWLAKSGFGEWIKVDKMEKRFCAWKK
ncbi:hypothetical protein [Helicobacter sp. T3_23-1056]